MRKLKDKGACSVVVQTWLVERNSFRLLPASRASGSITSGCRNGKNETPRSCIGLVGTVQ